MNEIIGFLFSILLFIFYSSLAAIFISIIIGAGLKLIRPKISFRKTVKTSFIILLSITITYLTFATFSGKYKNDSSKIPFDIIIWFDKMGIAED